MEYVLLTWSNGHKVGAGGSAWYKGDAGGSVADVVHRLLYQVLVIPAVWNTKKCSQTFQLMHLGNDL